MKVEIGIDEAGMGPAAGPMTMAVVAVPVTVPLGGVMDSKRLNDAKREDLVDLIHAAALFRKVIAVAPEDVDRLGISRSWRETARTLAIAAHKEFPDETIILDGNRLIGLNYVEPVVKADDKYPAVSAASILAKYMQSCWMDDYHEVYPEYGFDKHRGYLTKQHQEALAAHGPCACHRTSFNPIKRLLEQR